MIKFISLQKICSVFRFPPSYQTKFSRVKSKRRQVWREHFWRLNYRISKRVVYLSLSLPIGAWNSIKWKAKVCRQLSLNLPQIKGQSPLPIEHESLSNRRPKSAANWGLNHRQMEGRSPPPIGPESPWNRRPKFAVVWDPKLRRHFFKTFQPDRSPNPVLM